MHTCRCKPRVHASKDCLSRVTKSQGLSLWLTQNLCPHDNLTAATLRASKAEPHLSERLITEALVF